MVTREDILRTAGELITGDRQRTYGSAKASHATIAGMWSAYLGVPVTGLYGSVRACLASAADTPTLRRPRADTST
jgi:hypothetical protein